MSKLQLQWVEKLDREKDHNLRQNLIFDMVDNLDPDEVTIIINNLKQL